MSLKLVTGWRNLWRAWSMQLAALGLVLPELLQLVADNTSLLSGMNDGWKAVIRVACLAGVIVLRPIQQRALTAAVAGERHDAE